MGARRRRRGRAVEGGNSRAWKRGECRFSGRAWKGEVRERLAKKKKNTLKNFLLLLFHKFNSSPRRVTLCPFDFFVAPSIMQSTLSMRSVVSRRASARAHKRAEAQIKSKGETLKRSSLFSPPLSALFGFRPSFCGAFRRAFLAPTGAHKQKRNAIHKKKTAHDRPGPPHGE